MFRRDGSGRRTCPHVGSKTGWDQGRGSEPETAAHSAPRVVVRSAWNPILGRLELWLAKFMHPPSHLDPCRVMAQAPTVSQEATPRAPPGRGPCWAGLPTGQSPAQRQRLPEAAGGYFPPTERLPRWSDSSTLHRNDVECIQLYVSICAHQIAAIGISDVEQKGGV